MQRTTRALLNIIFFVQILVLFLFLLEDRLSLPVWLQIAGRLHPAIVHLPIGGLILCVVLVFAEGQFKKKGFNKIVGIVLLFTSLTCSLTALFGIFLAKQGDYGVEPLIQHKSSGIILSFLCYFLLLAFVYARKLRILHYGLGIVTVGTVVFAGHSGSVLTHGENFVWAPLREHKARLSGAEGGPNGARLVTPNKVEWSARSAYQNVIYPILEKKCTSCHNVTKAKGKFVMTSMEELVKGGEHGVAWVAGKPKESRMIQYIHLPLEDDDHMPPEGKTQLTQSEIRLLELWIASGADVQKRLSDFPERDTFKIVASAALAAIKTAIKEKSYPFSSASEETIKKLNTPFRAVFPLYQNSPALQADFFVKESFQSSALEELVTIKDQLVVLNLSKMPVTDNDLKIIGNFRNLEKLNLNFSTIDGSGLSTLGSLEKLESISLAGTAVTAKSLEPLLAMSSLREVFVWNTMVTEEEKNNLEINQPETRKHSNTQTRFHTTQFKDETILRLGKPMLENETVLKKGEPVVLRHSMPGAIIRYTLDGSKPDSLNSNTYEKPITLTTTTTIKAIACRQGWYCSELFEAVCFVEGFKPVSAHLLTAPDKQYPGEGDKSLVDWRKGFIDVFKEPSWLGYQNDSFVAAFDFGTEPPTVNSLVISYGKNVGSHIMPPEEVEVWAGKNSGDAKLIQAQKIIQPTGYDPAQLAALTLPLKASKFSYYKLVLKPVAKLPKWHSGKGKKGWVFVDEVFFY